MMNHYTPPYLLDDHSISARQTLVEVGQWINSQGWCPATGGNFSLKINQSPKTSGLEENSAPPTVSPARYLVTASGVHKGNLNLTDFLEVDLEGRPLTSSPTARPSAETLIHVALYALDPEIGAVLHIHSLANTVLSLAEPSDRLIVEGLEMQKALRGNTSHAEPLSLEIFNNTQDMTALAVEIETRWRASGGLKWGLLVRGHGAYVWGRDLAEARRHLEGVEFILSCLLELKRLGVSLPVS